MVLGVSTRDITAWTWVAVCLGCHYLYTRSTGAPPFWASVENSWLLLGRPAGRAPPLLWAGGEQALDAAG